MKNPLPHVKIEDIGANVYDKVKDEDIKSIIAYIHYLHQTIQSYNDALYQLKTHLPNTANDVIPNDMHKH